MDRGPGFVLSAQGMLAYPLLAATLSGRKAEVRRLVASGRIEIQ
jgi:hypothetical protein